MSASSVSSQSPSQVDQPSTSSSRVFSAAVVSSQSVVLATVATGAPSQVLVGTAVPSPSPSPSVSGQ